MDLFEDLVKAHYARRRLTESRVEEILRSCDEARHLHRWKSIAIGAISVAAASLVALGITLITVERGGTPAGAERLAARFPHQLVAVRIHADGCARSNQMAPIFEGLQKEFANEPILFVTFDRSTGAITHQTDCLSKILGLEKIFKECRRTGEIVVAAADGDGREIVETKDGLLAARDIVRHRLLAAR